MIGIFGLFLNRKNIIILLMSIELMLLSVNINFVAFSAYLNDYVGQIFTLFVLTVAAAEAAIGLAILVCFFRNKGYGPVVRNEQTVVAGGGEGALFTLTRSSSNPIVHAC